MWEVTRPPARRTLRIADICRFTAHARKRDIRIHDTSDLELMVVGVAWPREREAAPGAPGGAAARRASGVRVARSE